MISVILPTKNGERFIAEAIESVLSQSEKGFELIIVNDGSTDGTVRIVNAFINADSRVKLLTTQESVGTGRSRSRGINASTSSLDTSTDYIALIDDDDVWVDKEKLLIQKMFLDTHPDHVLVGALRIKEIDEKGDFLSYYTNPSTDEVIRREMLKRSCFITSSVMFRKDAYDKAGGFQNLYRVEDYDLWLRLGKIGKMANLTNAEIAYRIRKADQDRKKEKEWYRAIIKLLKVYKNDYKGYVPGILRAYARLVYHALFHGMSGSWIDRALRKIVRTLSS